MSTSQPHCSATGTAESFCQSVSISFCVAQLTTSEMAGVNLKCGPPFSAVSSMPASRKATVMTDPFGPGPASP